MKPFKFFEKEDVITISFNDDTPEGHMNRRRLYHTNQIEYDRLRGNNNNEMEQYFYDRSLRAYQPDDEQISEITRRINGGGTMIPFLTGPQKVTKVNPKWWMKIKIFFQEQFWFKDPNATAAIGIGILASIALTIFTIFKLIKHGN